MKNVFLILALAMASFAVVANHNHDGKKGKKAKCKKECCSKTQAASADGTVPACCSKMKADGKSCSKEHAKAAEGKPACTGHGHGAEAAPKAQ